MKLSSAIQHVERKGMLLVFPHGNRREPPSLWHEFFPRRKMRWEWDESGDSGVAALWFLREKLSRSGRVIYGKWYRDKATLVSLDLFAAIICLANPELPDIRGLTFQAREILDLLNEDSPLSTKQIKRMSGLQGRASETQYTRALKELWTRGLIVAYGEVDEGSFPSLAIGSTRVLFEDLWAKAEDMSLKEAEDIVVKCLPEGSSFEKYLRSLKRQWTRIEEEGQTQ